MNGKTGGVVEYEIKVWALLIFYAHLLVCR